MPLDRPPNHVERALQDRLGPLLTADKEPAWTEAQVAWMERNFPPRCLGTQETVESHLRYAGVSAFVAARRSALEAQKASSAATDPEDPEDFTNAEHV